MSRHKRLRWHCYRCFQSTKVCEFHTLIAAVADEQNDFLFFMCFAVAAIFYCVTPYLKLNVNKQFSEYHFEGDDDATDFLLRLSVAWHYIRMLKLLPWRERHKYNIYSHLFLWKMNTCFSGCKHKEEEEDQIRRGTKLQPRFSRGKLLW